MTKQQYWIHFIVQQKLTHYKATIPQLKKKERKCTLEPDGNLAPSIRHDWVTSLSLFTFMHWRRKWQATPVFLPGESQGRGSLMGRHLWGRTESDTTELI